MSVVRRGLPGVAACAFDNDLEALARTREFFDFLPLSNREDPPTRATDDPAYGRTGAGIRAPD